MLCRNLLSDELAIGTFFKQLEKTVIITKSP